MANRLALETSPYLRQHADNPVEWYPWGDEALRRAREQDKPILLSVGYSACHWCHVMAHESFEDPAIASVMNRLFVNIKVDREERPDIDQIYQTAHQLLTRRGGGWPLTMFLTPDQRPFFGGTYFPKTPRYSLPGFGDLLEKVARAYYEQGEAIAAQNEELVSLLARTVAPAIEHPAALDRAVVSAALEALESSFDPVHGGLGAAPKFPHPFELDLCLSEGVTRGNAQAKHVALFTLERMALGGVYDQLGGGFYRYSVDGHWTIPHFEKMLYDNGPLLRLYADAWVVTGNPLFARVCRETAAWVMREMQTPDGGYCSSLDADSEHEEGRFYVWSHEQVAGLLSSEERAVAAPVFGLDRAPNFEGVHWHLRIAQPLAETAAALRIHEGAAQALLDSARRKLLDARGRRVRPARDDKVLTAWNALMIEAMAHAGRALGEPAWIESARRALGCIRAALWRGGRLLATCRDTRAHLNAYLDDYAFLIGALLELMQADFERQDLTFACELADVLLDQFEERGVGGFFFTSHDHERLILRTKPGHDGAMPSGNGRAALALQRLGHLIGEPRYLAAARHTLELFQPQMEQQPSAFATLCAALTEHLDPPSIVVLRGEADGLASWLRRLAHRYAPSELLVALGPEQARLPGALEKSLLPGVNAWVCRGVSCLPPIADPGELERVLQTRP